MTREEAVKHLDAMIYNAAIVRGIVPDKYDIEALRMAIEALTHDKRTETHGVCSEQATDLISRQAAIDALAGEWYNCGADYRTAVSVIRKLPSAELKTWDCTGCKLVGLYDAEFPCTNCVRKPKDYYCRAKMEVRK